MEYAEKMLEETELSIAEVSYSSGFSDPLYFSSVFRRFKGTSPTEYKRLKTKEGKSE
jgi:AraC-like DNA-binding protein